MATWVFMKATDAWAFAASADPALKPNQPNHSRPAPSRTNGTLCGRIGSLGHPMRLPITSAMARPAIPALRWTAVPPAKSRAPMWSARKPPSLVVVRSPKKNTQWATGK